MFDFRYIIISISFLTRIVMMWNRCTRKRGNVPKMIMKTLLDLQKLRKMENLIEKREAVVVLPHLLENLIPRAESDICPLCLCQNSYVWRINYRDTKSIHIMYSMWLKYIMIQMLNSIHTLAINQIFKLSSTWICSTAFPWLHSFLGICKM